jgi:hypothetical protein
MSFQYKHVPAHQDRLKPWSRLSLEEQLNVICDKLANGAVRHYLSYSSPLTRKLQLLPLEKAAVFVGTEKMMTDVGPEVCFQLGREGALRFYTSPVVLVGRVNKGGLDWLWRRFEQVSWSTLELVLHSMPDMYQLWLSKQCIGICATRRTLAYLSLHPGHPGRHMPKLRSSPGDIHTPKQVSRQWLHSHVQGKHYESINMDAPAQSH